MDDAVISLEKILKANKRLIKNKIFNIVGENLKKSDLIKRVSKNLKKKIKLKVKKVSLDKRDYKVSGRKFIKMFGKMKTLPTRIGLNFIPINGRRGSELIFYVKMFGKFLKF